MSEQIWVNGYIFQSYLGYLVGGFNPFEKYESKWESSPNRDENRKYLKPQPRYVFQHGFIFQSYLGYIFQSYLGYIFQS